MYVAFEPPGVGGGIGIHHKAYRACIGVGIIGWVNAGHKGHPVIDAYVGVAVRIVAVVTLIAAQHDGFAAGYENVTVGLDTHTVLIVSNENERRIADLPQVVGSGITVAAHKPGLVGGSNCSLVIGDGE